ncbi:MAG TPA: hypothetical protein VFN21_00360, partial [Acidimicrobiales bacterium]|nr:hypothetical protein [Acidimicrobiales bacterium]
AIWASVTGTPLIVSFASILFTLYEKASMRNRATTGVAERRLLEVRIVRHRGIREAIFEYREQSVHFAGGQSDAFPERSTCFLEDVV